MSYPRISQPQHVAPAAAQAGDRREFLRTMGAMSVGMTLAHLGADPVQGG